MMLKLNPNSRSLATSKLRSALRLTSGEPTSAKVAFSREPLGDELRAFGQNLTEPPPGSTAMG